jgi:hypothetical protein
VSELACVWESRRRNRPVISPLLEETNVLSLGFEFFYVSFSNASARVWGLDRGEFSIPSKQSYY